MNQETLRHLSNKLNKNGDTRGCYIIHGMSQSRLYKIWVDMKRRCYNSHNKYYFRYGGRGIKVCDEWKNNFIAFADWALNNGYQDHLSIERNNIDGDYEPDNCSWITSAEQQKNTSRTHYITINGVTKCMSEWARIYQISPDLIKDRINKLHWNDYDAVTTPKLSSRFDKLNIERKEKCQ